MPAGGAKLVEDAQLVRLIGALIAAVDEWPVPRVCKTDPFAGWV
jgi:hypothetical protein